MTFDTSPPQRTRRQLIQLIGAAAGASASYRAMAALDMSAPSDYSGPIELKGGGKGKSVLVLGAGLAGLVAALELRKAGYTVQVLEYNAKAGGRNWSIRGGDRYTELGGAVQNCEFDKDLYINPGPWRIPYHHYGVLDYCRRLKVKLEPFIQVNYNAYMHSTTAFGGKPQRFRQIQADYFGGVAELLAKSTMQHKLDDTITKEEQDVLVESLRSWGALDRNLAYVSSVQTSERRGYDKQPGGGLTAASKVSTPLAFGDVLKSRTWAALAQGQSYVWHSTIFQPVGGMDMISKGFVKEVGSLIKYNAKVVAIQQSDKKVTVTYEDTAKGGARQTATADWCVCTIPLSILSQIEIGVGAEMREAISAVPYGQSVKVGLQFKRRFWEQDEQIYGGITNTDLPIGQIAYPNTNYHGKGRGVLLGAFPRGVNAMEIGSMSPAERVRTAVEQGAQIHPQYKTEFENGIAVAWSRVPWTLGCAGSWSPETRAKHYVNLCQIDGRIVLAGEHASFIGGWQEGAVLSSIDAITRLHQRALAG